MEHQKDESMIYLKDLLFDALHHWRAVLVVALIGAVLLGGMKGISYQNNATGATTDAQYQAELKQYQLNKQTLTSKVQLLQEHLESQQHYLENSIFMELNPYEFYAATLNLHIDTAYQIFPEQAYQNVDKTAAVLAAYEASFLGETVGQQLADAVKTQPQFMQELIVCTVTPSSGTIVITVLYPTKDDTNTLLEALVAQIDPLQTNITASVAKHTVSILDQSVTSKIDPALATKQSEATSRLTSLQTTLAETKQQLAALVVPEQAAISAKAVIKNVLIFAVLGAFGGAFGAVCAIWVMHIASAKVFSARTLRNRTGIKVLGCLPQEKSCLLDRWLRKLEGRCSCDAQTQAALLAVNIRNHCGESKHVVVSGNPADPHRKLLVQTLHSTMPGVQITDVDDFCNPAALEALSVCDTVLLIEQCGVSRYFQVIERIDLIKDYKKTLIGCILIGG